MSSQVRLKVTQRHLDLQLKLLNIAVQRGGIGYIYCTY